jgi:hypothetical protein
VVVIGELLLPAVVRLVAEVCLVPAQPVPLLCLLLAYLQSHLRRQQGCGQRAMCRRRPRARRRVPAARGLARSRPLKGCDAMRWAAIRCRVMGGRVQRAAVACSTMAGCKRVQQWDTVKERQYVKMQAAERGRRAGYTSSRPHCPLSTDADRRRSTTKR